MRSRWIPVAAFLVLAAVFALDVATPQTLVVAILLDVPIALGALAGSRRLIALLVLVSLVADVLAGYVNGAQAGNVWDAVGIADRGLAALSIVLVGYLSGAVLERAKRAGQAAAQEARARREAELAQSIDRVRGSLSFDLVVRSIVREGFSLLDATAARWIPAQAGAEALEFTGGAEVGTLDGTQRTEFVSLARRALDTRDVQIVSNADAFGRLVLEAVDASAALVLPFADQDRTYGVLVLSGGPRGFDEATLAVGRPFARTCSAALTQARLFNALAQRNDELAERSAVIRDLVYALSHDLRTPLAALEMTLQQARGGAYGDLPERYRDVLGAEVAAVEDLQRLADTLLRVARFETGERPGPSEPVDLCELAREVAKSLEALASARGVALAVNAPQATPANGYRGDLRRAIANLVANALENTPSGGHVTVDAGVVDDRARVVVEDDGFGVPPELRENLFARFAGSTRPSGGTGLGLYLARRVAEEAGGSIAYEPRTPRGSAFTLSLPAAAPVPA